jgi:hypothetical protein
VRLMHKIEYFVPGSEQRLTWICEDGPSSPVLQMYKQSLQKCTLGMGGLRRT